jgi:CBS domain-containing protein
LELLRLSLQLSGRGRGCPAPYPIPGDLGRPSGPDGKGQATGQARETRGQPPNAHEAGPYYPEPVDEVVRTVADAMLTIPTRHPLAASVREIGEFFRDDHVHAALIVSPAGYLAAVVERGDIADSQAPDAAAAPLGRLAGRTVPAGASLAEAWRALDETGQRRAAVTSIDGRLLGLLCLKASRAGFCSDQDVYARARPE